MKNHKVNSLSIIILIAIAFFGMACVNEKHDDHAAGKAVQKAKLPYDLAKPTQYDMPQNLFEISGIVFHNGNAKEVFAIQDEDGDLFRLGLGDKEAKLTKFGGKGDYEDVTLIKDHVIVLKSNGELHTFPIAEVNKPEAVNVIKTKDLVPKAEYEGLAADDQTGMVYILTKDSKPDSKNKKTSIYAFKCADDGSLKANGTFYLSHKDIAALSGNAKSRFRPSALAKNQKTNEWYVLSSVNKLLVVTDVNFKVKATYPLNSDLFNQPEGIAFDQNHNLYISNEGGTLSAGNILLFKWIK